MLKLHYKWGEHSMNGWYKTLPNLAGFMLCTICFPKYCLLTTYPFPFFFFFCHESNSQNLKNPIHKTTLSIFVRIMIHGAVDFLASSACLLAGIKTFLFLHLTGCYLMCSDFHCDGPKVCVPSKSAP